MKLREQGAVLNHGNKAQDRLPASLLRVLCPSTQSSQASGSRGELLSPGHFLREPECEQGVTSDAIQGTSWDVFSAAGCRLPHTLVRGKKGNSWLKATLAHPEPVWSVCVPQWSCWRVPFLLEKQVKHQHCCWRCQLL